MSLITKIRSAIGGGDDGPEEPTHRCRSCGEEYFATPSTTIETCRQCGGIKVEPAG
jgi:ribosomal protein L37AE/L43A